MTPFLLAILIPPSPISLGDISARLRVHIEEQPAGPGLARVRYSLAVEGPSGLQVDTPLLEDAQSAWKVVGASSSWRPGSPDRCETVLRIVQVKPGYQPLPGVRVRVRSRSDQPWQDVVWPSPLRDSPRLLDLPPLEEPATSRDKILIAGLVLVLALGLLGWLLLRNYQRSARGPDPWSPPELTRRLRQAREKPADMENLLKGYLAHRFGLPAGSMTPEEWGSALHQQADLPDFVPEAAQGWFSLLDRSKFAGPAGQSANASQMYSDLVRIMATLEPRCFEEKEKNGEGG